MPKLKFLAVIFAGLNAATLWGAPLPSHVAGPSDVIARLDQVNAGDLSRYLLGTSAGYLLTEPLLRSLWAGQVVSDADWVGIKALTAMRYRINTGRLDDASNMFVYTCRGGWLDLGHVISSALGYKLFYQALGRNLLFDMATILALEPEDLALYRKVGPEIRNRAYVRSGQGEILGREYWAAYFAMRASVHVEEYQRRAKLKKPMHLWGANARSAYTLEDLPSNFIGVQLGSRLERKVFTKGVVLQFQAELVDLFKRLGGVELSTPLRIAGCAASAGEVLNEDAAYYTGQAYSTYVPVEKTGHRESESVYNFSIRPKRTLQHHCVCGPGDEPRA